MRKRFVLLAGIFILLGIGLLVLPEKDHSENIPPETLLNAVNNTSRYLSTDQVAEKIIYQDPTYILVDVRTPDQYELFHLPGALNIPLDELLLEEWEYIFEQDEQDIILYSNSDLLADQAWILNRRSGNTQQFVMKGGLNCWFETIIKPPVPKSTDPAEVFDLYQFRQGARIYFGGGNIEIEPGSEPEPVIVKQREKKTTTEGGC